MIENTQNNVELKKGDICRFKVGVKGMTLAMVTSVDGDYYSAVEVAVGTPTKPTHLQHGPYVIRFEKNFTYSKKSLVKKIATVEMDFSKYLLDLSIKRGVICRFQGNQGMHHGLIISNDTGNKFASIILVALVEKGEATEPSHMQVGPYVVKFEQVFTYSKERVVKKIMEVEENFDQFLSYSVDPYLEFSAEPFKKVVKGFHMLSGMLNERPSVKWGQLYFITTNKNPVGSEQGGERIVMVISNNDINSKNDSVLVIPGTKQKKNPLPTHFDIQANQYGDYPNDTTFMAEQAAVVSIKEFEGLRTVGSIPLEFGEKIKGCYEIATAKDVARKLREIKYGEVGS